MRQCPKCNEWSVDFDDYFGRFRCLNPRCGWMLLSSAEREIRLLRSHTRPTRLDPITLPELDLTLTASYDSENDALSVDFGLDEPTFDLPEPDGKLMWHIARRSNTVAGFTITDAIEGNISSITVEFLAKRRSDIERALGRISGVAARGRATRAIVEQIVVRAMSDETTATEVSPETRERWGQMVNRVKQFSV